MATQRTALDEASIRERIGRLAGSIRAMDLEGVMSNYATDIVSFDVQQPLRKVGAAGKRQNWVEAFTVFQPPLDYEVRDLSIMVGDNVAFAYSLNRLAGILKNGTSSGPWVRSTLCFRKIDGNWLIAHDHGSLPVDVQTGR